MARIRIQCGWVVLIILSLIQQKSLFNAMEFDNHKIPRTTPGSHRDHNTDRDLERKASKRKARNQAHDYYITSHAYNTTPNLKNMPSQIEGVTMTLLEIARDRTMRNVPTSCAEIIQSKFGHQSPEPLHENNKIVTNSKEKRDLMFLHIPKNGGTCIEQTIMSYESKLAAKHIHGHLDEWSSARRGYLDGRGRVHVANAVTLNVRIEESETHPAGEGQCSCSYWHIPIRYLKKTAGGQSALTPDQDEKAVNAYQDSDVFCVTRDPLSRALSEFNMRSPKLSRAGAHEYLVNLAAKLYTKKVCRDDCHLLPQYEFVWDFEGTRTCHHVLPMSSLKESFDDMMAQRGRKTRLPSAENSKKWNHHNWLVGDNNVTDISVQEIDPEVAKLVRCAYAADLCLLGFDPATGKNLASPLTDTGCSL